MDNNDGNIIVLSLLIPGIVLLGTRMVIYYYADAYDTRMASNHVEF